MLGRTFAAAPDPELARVAFSRVGDDPRARAALAMPEITDIAARLLGFSTAAADFLVANPGEVAMFADVERAIAGRARCRVAGRPSIGWAPSTVCAGSGAGPCSASPRATWGAHRSTRSSPRSARSPTPASPRRSNSPPGGDTLAVIGLGKLGGYELNYASDVDLLFLHAEHGTRGAGGRRARGGRRHLVARRSHRRRHRAPCGRGTAARRAIRCAEPFARGDPRLLRAGVGHVGAPGDDQGPSRRGPGRPGPGLRAGDRTVRLSARAGARGDRRRAAHEGPAGGIHPAARQGVHGGQARPWRHPRRGVRGAAPADRARAERREAPHAHHARRPAGARDRGLRR